MNNTTEASTAPRDIDAELRELHGATAFHGYGWRIANMSDGSKRVEVAQYRGDHHMTTRAWAREVVRDCRPDYVVGKFLRLTHVRVDGIQQTRRVYELKLA